MTCRRMGTLALTHLAKKKSTYTTSTDLCAFQWILNLADATRKLARWCLRQNLPVSLKERKDNNLVCSVCDDEVHGYQHLTAIADEMTNSANEPPCVEEFIEEQSTNDLGKKAATSVGMPGLHYKLERFGFLIRQEFIDAELQKVA